MKGLTIQRVQYLLDRTLGLFLVEEGEHIFYQCKDLGRPWRNNHKWDGDPLTVSCIPAGIYPFRRVHSPELGREVIAIDNVPGRGNILIHNGNFPVNSHGCEIVGLDFADINHDGINDVAASNKALDGILAALGEQMDGLINVIGDGRDTLKAA